MLIKPLSQPFPRRLAGSLLLAGSAMAFAGWLSHPVSIEKHIEATHVLRVGEHQAAWIWSYRLLVFGLFLRLGGLVSLGTLFTEPGDRAILWPSIAIACAGLAIGAMGEGYYMDLVIHAGWRFAHDASTDVARTTLLDSWVPMTEWVACLQRMGSMFLALGTAGASIALWRSRRTISILGLAIAIGTMMTLMARPDGFSLRIAFTALTGWHLLLGAVVLRWRE